MIITSATIVTTLAQVGKLKKRKMASFNPSILTCLEDYEQSARSKVKESAWSYYSEGSFLGQTKKENIEAFKK